MPLSQCWGDSTLKDETKCQSLCVHPRTAQNLPARPPQMALPSQLSLYDQVIKDRLFLVFLFSSFPCFFFSPTGEGNGSLYEKINPWPCVLFLSLTSVQNHVNGTVLMHKKYEKYSGLNTGKLCSFTREHQVSLTCIFLYTLGKNYIFLPGILYEFAKVGVVGFFMSVANSHCNVCALDFAFLSCCLKLNK